MSRLKGVSHIGANVLGIAALATVVLAVLLARSPGTPSTVRAQGTGVGMSLEAEGISCDQSGCRVAPKSPFVLTVNASPPPRQDISGFAAEVGFGGLQWLQRAGCGDEVQVGRRDGEDLAVCTRQTGAGGEARYVVITSVQVPPLAPMQALANGDTLLELDVQCPAAGTYTAVLTAVRDEQDAPQVSPFGAFYAGLDTVPIYVDAKEMDVDLNGDTTSESALVADTLKVTCDPAAPTSSRPPPTDGGATTPAGTAGPTLEPDAATAAAATSAAQTAEATALSDEDATATAEAAAAGGEDENGGGVNPFVWVIIGVVAVAAVGGLGFLGWRRYAGRGQGPAE